MRNQIIRNRTIELVLLAALAIAILSAVLIARYSLNNNIPGQTAYYHMKIVKAMEYKPLSNTDPVSGNVYIPDAYDIILKFTSSLMAIDLASKILPIIINLGIIILIYLTMNKIFGPRNETFLGIAAILMSPIFIYTTLTGSSISFYVMISILTIYMLLFSGIIQYLIALLLSITVALSPNIYLTLSFFTLMISLLLIKKSQKTVYLIFLSSIIAVFYQAGIVLKYGFPNTLPFYQRSIFSYFISNLGATLGFGIFYAILAMIGLFLTWREKIKYAPLYILTVSLLILTLLYHDIIIMLNLPFCVLTGYAFNKLMTMKWKLKLIKNLTLAVIIIGLVFSIVTFTIRAADLGPNPEIIKALHFLQDKTSGKVLSYYNYGLWIEYFAEKPAVLDTYTFYAQNNSQVYNLSNEAFNSYSLQITKPTLNELNVSYILITSEMRNGLVWNEPDQGLLFLLQDNETFKSIYSTKDVEIWKYIHGETT